jgi:hypothetical protein
VPVTGKKVSLRNNQGQEVRVQTAICQCKVAPGGGMTLGGQCDTAHCSSTWSVAGGVLESVPHCQ